MTPVKLICEFTRRKRSVLIKSNLLNLADRFFSQAIFPDFVKSGTERDINDDTWQPTERFLAPKICYNLTDIISHTETENQSADIGFLLCYTFVF